MSPTVQATALVLYDGDCVLCRRSKRFIEQRDRSGRFRFITLQSESGHALLQSHGLPTDRFDSVVLIEGRTVSLRSTAILRICRQLSGAWPLLYAGIALPCRLRDRLYDGVTRRRNG